ncbi:MAG: transposase [Lewinellaceae bacterium]|nr:transposase [Lewinellaceae bacterium]
MRGACHKAKTDRIIRINPNLQRHKQIAHQNLWSLQGIRLRQQRCIEPEPVFGQIKWNRGFKRFLLRGLPKVTCEFGIVAIAHNFKKMWAKLQQARSVPLPPVLPPSNAQNPEYQLKFAFLTLFAAVSHLREPQHKNFQAKPILAFA